MLRAIRAKVKLVLSENPSGLDGACWGETKVIPLEAIAARMSAIGGSAVDYYAGSSAVTAMIPYKNGVLTAFARGPGDHVIHWSEDGKKLGGGSAVDYYAGNSAVKAMIPYKNGVLTAFSN